MLHSSQHARSHEKKSAPGKGFATNEVGQSLDQTEKSFQGGITQRYAEKLMKTTSIGHSRTNIV